jgi:Na+/H+ antiporter NhaD/arsenite permease-like protein
MMGMGVIVETGVFGDVSAWIDYHIHNVWVVGIVSGLLSSMVDTFTIAVSNLSLYPVLERMQLYQWADADYMYNFIQNGPYWLVIPFCTAVGGCLLSVGSTSGLALMKMEHVRLGWYLKNCTPVIAVGWLLGLAVLWLELYWL